MENLMSVEDVADILQVVPKTVWRLVRRGEIVASKVGRVIRIEPKEFRAFIERAKRKVANSPRKSY